MLYQDITTLRRTLEGRGTITQRREAGERLAELVGEARTWKLLALEVRVPPARAAANKTRRDALAGVLNVVLRSSVQFVHSFLSGQKKKAKLKLDDATLPKRLLIRIYAVGEGDKLDKDVTAFLFNFCLDVLESESAMSVDDVHEEYLTMLAFMCSKTEFVAHFRPDKQMQVVFDEVEKCLGVPNEGQDRKLLGKAADVFSNLVKTANALGISLHLLIRTSLEMISSLYERNTEAPPSDTYVEVVEKFLLGAAILMRGNPDLAVAPLREFGRPLLSLARRCSDSKGLTSQWGSVDDYFSAHLLVCQVAGQLQGYMPGDLGDVGKASLSFKHLANLLERLSSYMQCVPMLYARLIAQAQRIDLCTSEFEETDDFVSMLNELNASQRALDDYYTDEPPTDKALGADCSPDLLADTPFVSFLLRYLYAAGKSNFVNDIQQSEAPSGRWEEALDIATKELGTPNDRDVLSRLKVLCICTQLYPLGTCWTSNAQRYWYKVPGAMERLEPDIALGSSFGDLAIVVKTVGALLVTYGGLHAPTENQKWVITCLSCLAVATGALDVVKAPDRSSLEASWRIVWSNLFRSDLSYLVLTKTNAIGTIGDLILRLLVQIVRFSCLGTYDGFNVHSFIWKLPAFSAIPQSGYTLFWLLFTTIRKYGLAETDEDVIGQTLGASWESLASSLGHSRRSRLMSYCFYYIQNQRSVTGSATSVACRCLVALMNYVHPPPWPIFENEVAQRPVAGVLYLFRSESTFFYCEDLERIVQARRQQDLEGEPVESLWGPVLSSTDPLPMLAQSDEFTVGVAGSVYSRIIEVESGKQFVEILEQENPSAVAMLQQSVESTLTSANDSTGATVSKLVMLKVYLSISMSTVVDAESFTAASSVAAGVIGSIRFDDGKFFEDGEELVSALVELSMITKSLMSAATFLKIRLCDTSFASTALKLSDSCADLLDQYRFLNQGEEGSRSSVFINTEEADKFDDEERGWTTGVDGGKSGKKRRSRAGEDHARKRQRKATLPSSYLTSQSALLSAFLFLTLNPNAEGFVSAAEALLGVEDIKDQVVDCVGALDALALFRSFESLSVVPGKSPSAILLAIRVAQSLRANTDPGFEAFYFHSFLEFMKYRRSYFALPAVGNEAISSLINLLHCEDDRGSLRILKTHPCARVSQLDTAVAFFMGADAYAHEAIDSIYGKSFILPFLSDLNRWVRRWAFLGTEAAMNHMNEREVSSAVRDVLLPAVGKQSSYKRWFSNFLVSRKDDEAPLAELESRVWQDARESFQCDINTKCWPIVAEHDREVRQQVLFDIIWLASKRPEAQFLYFQAIEGIAIRTGYDRAERLIDYENRYLTHRWLEVNETLSGIPLVLCAPAICRKLLLSNQQCMEDLENIRRSNESIFFSRSASNLIPRIVSLSVGANSSRTRDGRRALFEDELMRQFCYESFGRFDDETVVNLLKEHYVSIMSDCLLKKLSDHDAGTPNGVIALVKSLLPDFAERNRRYVSRICKLVVGTMGNDLSFIDGVDFDLALRVLKDMLGTEVSSAVELTIFAKYLFATTSNAADSLLRWKVLDCLVRFGVEKADAGLLPIYSTFLTELVEDPMTSTFRNEVLLTTVDVCQLIAHSPFATSFLSSAKGKDLLGCILDIHIGAQKQAMDLFESSRRTQERVKWIEGASASPDFDEGFSVVATSTLASILSSETKALSVTNTLKRSFEALGILLDKIRACGLEVSTFNCFANQRKSELEDFVTALSLVDMRFAVQLLFAKRQMDGNEYHEIDVEFLCSLSNNTILVAELGRAERLLRANGSRSREVLPFCLGLCSPDYPQDVRIAAARCVGEIQISNDSLVAERDTVDFVGHTNLMQYLQASIIESLVKSTKGTNPRHAAIACETLKALLLSTDGKGCRQLIRRDDVKSFISELCKSGDSSSELLTLKDFEKLEWNNIESSEESCWSPSLWATSCGESVSLVVASLLDCYFSSSTTNPLTSHQDSFLSFCQRMSYINVEFARVVFPAVVFALLIDGDKNPPFLDSTDINRVSIDTWVGQPSSALNESLSESFSSVLRHSLQQNDKQFLISVLDTLDLLRSFTQERFLSSPNQSRVSDVHESHGAYIPFGTVLKLDGELVSEACIAAARYESALFYAELFAEGRYGSSSVKLETQTGEVRAHLYSDISGFDGNQQSREANPSFDDKRTYYALLSKAYNGLAEVDSKRAIEKTRGASDFSSYETDLALSTQVTHSFYKLELQENSLLHMRNSPKLSMELMQSLEDLDLLSGMRCFVESLEAHGTLFTERHDKDLLSEKLNQCRLFERGWDDSCFSPESQPVDSRQSKGRLDSHSASFLDSCDGGFFSSMNSSLELLQTKSYGAATKSLYNARMSCLADLSLAGNRRLMLHDFSERMRAVNFLEDFSADPSLQDTLLDRFGSNISMTPLSQFIQEATLRTILQSLDDEKQFQGVAQLLQSHLERIFESNLVESRKKAAHGALKRLGSVYQYFDKIKSEGHVERLLGFRLREARLMERSGDSNGAIHSSKLTISKLLQEPNRDELTTGENGVLVDAFTLSGEWIAKYKVEPAAAALEKYIRPAIRVASLLDSKEKSTLNSKRMGRALATQIVLANSLYEGARARIESLEWIGGGEDLLLRTQKLKQDEKKLKTMKKTEQGAKQLAVNVTWLRKEIAETTKNRSMFEQTMEQHRIIVLESLVEALSTGVCDEAEASNHVYRLASMLFSCQEDGKWSQTVNDLSTRAVSIPSFRFVPLFSQMLSRLETKEPQNRQFQEFLYRLVWQIAFDHPYHCIVPLMALTENDSQENSKVGKSEAAKSILALLRKDDPEFVGQLILGYGNLAAAYTHLAVADVSKFDQGKQAKKISFDPVCEKQPLLRLDRCLGTGTRKIACPPCILTKLPKIQRDSKYGHGAADPIGTERILSFESYFTVTPSGQSRPRVVICIGTQGGRYKQLVKGNDDTRQDSVMEQVFCFVNELLARPVEGKVRRSQAGHQLKLVTYNVIPLSRKAGVLEFVDHAAAFGDFVKGTGSKAHQVGAHKKYYPHQWRMVQVHSAIKEAEKAGKNQRETFELVCKNFSPVFRFFFVEKFGHSTEQWFLARTKYTRSVAVSSIVGHILGIGDRHCNNILVQQQTGEVIHIDFGFVFEQGRRLRIPERVPFRLTRNVVDGMGPLGTEGVFTAAAEQTLEVLQENQSGLLTILSAIASDPLYIWTQHTEDDAPARGKKQPVISQKRNAEAALALSRIQEKLRGYEDGTQGEQQSVPSQVQLLVNEAQDVGNLCRMYSGWAPYI